MKVTPNLYVVSISDCSTWDTTQEKFDKKQDKYKEFDFFDLTKFDPEDKYTQSVIKESELTLTEEQLLKLAIVNITFTVKQKLNVEIDITKQLIELAEKPIRLITESGSGDNIYNTKCEVHMPGHSLSMYNEMLLLEDICTDVLQSNLNSGWRIVACCPQPDNRRPDYILGRFNPDFECSGTAERGD